MVLQVFLRTCHCHKACREGPHSSMVQHSMLLEVLVHTVLVATKHAGNSFTSVWIIGVCFFRLNFGLVILPQNLQGKASLLYGVCSFRLDFILAMMTPNLQQRHLSCMAKWSKLFQDRLQNDYVIHFFLSFLNSFTSS